VNLNDISKITQAASTETQKLQASEASLAQFRSKLATLNTKLAFNSKYWTYLDKLHSSVTQLSLKLSTTRDEARLANLKQKSSKEDIIAIVAVLGVFGSFIALTYFVKD